MDMKRYAYVLVHEETGTIVYSKLNVKYERDDIISLDDKPYKYRVIAAWEVPLFDEPLML